MSRTRQAVPSPDPAVVRTAAVGFSSGYCWTARRSAWGQLLWASRGAINATVTERRWFVPSARALWLPPHMQHDVTLVGRGVLRTLYLAPHHVGSLPTSSGLVVFAPLLRALVVRAFERGTLRDDVATDSRVAALLVDELCSALQQSHEPMDLPLPQDGRALRASELMQQLPGARLAELALVRESGASRRTLERLFVAQTGLTLGEWQQRNALLHGMRCVVDGMNVAQAALAAGYTSPSAFIAAYRRLTGTTPGRAAGTGRNAPRSAADPLGTGTVEHGEPRGLTRTRTAAPDTKKRR